ncbi:MAG TPA: phage holin family protein [Candidatus Microsaccharimonas sp.]|nr:phage holin family protein [Candidatus Microsaccharimonas sp.]
MPYLVFRLCLRWLVCSLGLWIAAGLLGSGINYNQKLSVIVVAGLVLAIVNLFIRPIVVLLSLPAILLSLGFFMLIVNGLMVLLVSKLYTPLHITNFWAAIFAGAVIGLVNYLVTTIVEEKKSK